MIYILVGSLICYCLFLLIIQYGWFSTKARCNSLSSPQLTYSIIVPFRNEACNLKDLLDSLSTLDFPKNNYEVILVNDHSSDLFESVVGAFLGDNIRLLNLQQGEGKKAALSYGIEQSFGDVIVTTDADCMVPKSWLKIYAYYFEKLRVKMAFGGVAFKRQQSFFERIQQVEFASLVGSGAATLKLGLPSMCNGANLAYDKKTFNNLQGFSDNLDVPSGDDEFLMQKIYRNFSGEVAYIKCKGAVVQTNAQQSFAGFFQQRKRWASKWKTYAKWSNSLLALIVFLLNASIIAALALAVVNFSYWLLGLLILKFLLEAIFLKSVLKSLNSRLYISAFIFLQICYPFYVVLFGFTANFGHYRWKGRKHKL